MKMTRKSGWPKTSVTDENVEAVEHLIIEDRWMNLKNLIKALNTQQVQALSILHLHLGMMSAKTVRTW